MSMQIANFGGREIVVASPSDILEVSFISPFATLVIASSLEEQDEVIKIAGDLLSLGCKEFCCVGLQAESLHDQLDILIESAELFDTVTTWHDDALEGCEYFLYGAGGQSLNLYGLISRHPELLNAMALAGQAD